MHATRLAALRDEREILTGAMAAFAAHPRTSYFSGEFTVTEQTIDRRQKRIAIIDVEIAEALPLAIPQILTCARVLDY